MEKNLPETSLTVTNVEYSVSEITFSEYDKLLSDAKLVAEYISTMTVTEDNIKEVKKVLAKANAAIKELNNKRITIKKDILKPYDNFALQIKDIENVVKTADEVVRNQVKILEEEERRVKEDKIYKIFLKRIKQYDYAKLITFDKFIKPQHLNKSVTIKKVEEEMVEFLEKVENDIANINSLDYENMDFNVETVISEYKKCLDPMEAYTNVKQEFENIKKVTGDLKDIIVNSDEDLKLITKYIFTISNEKDAKIAKLLLENNDIKYTYKEL